MKFDTVPIKLDTIPSIRDCRYKDISVIDRDEKYVYTFGLDTHGNTVNLVIIRDLTPYNKDIRIPAEARSITSADTQHWPIFDRLYGSRDAWQKSLEYEAIYTVLNRILYEHYDAIGNEFNATFSNEREHTVHTLGDVSPTLATQLTQSSDYNPDVMTLTCLCDVDPDTMQPSTEEHNDSRIVRLRHEDTSINILYSINLKEDTEMDVSVVDYDTDSLARFERKHGESDITIEEQMYEEAEKWKQRIETLNVSDDAAVSEFLHQMADVTVERSVYSEEFEDVNLFVPVEGPFSISWSGRSQYLNAFWFDKTRTHRIGFKVSNVRLREAAWSFATEQLAKTDSL